MNGRCHCTVGHSKHTATLTSKTVTEVVFWKVLVILMQVMTFFATGLRITHLGSVMTAAPHTDSHHNLLRWSGSGGSGGVHVVKRYISRLRAQGCCHSETTKQC